MAPMPASPNLPAVPPSVRGLVACLMALEQEAATLNQTLAAHLIAAAAAAVLDEAATPGERDDGIFPPGD